MSSLTTRPAWKISHMLSQIWQLYLCKIFYVLVLLFWMFKTRIFILLVCEFCLALPNFMFFIDFQSDCIWNYCGLTWKTFLLCLKTKGTLTFTTITFCLINCNAWQGEEGGGPHFAEWFLGSTWRFQLMIINIDGDRWWSSIKIMVVVIINKDYGRWWSRRWYDNSTGYWGQAADSRWCQNLQPDPPAPSPEPHLQPTSHMKDKNTKIIKYKSRLSRLERFSWKI